VVLADVPVRGRAELESAGEIMAGSQIREFRHAGWLCAFPKQVTKRAEKYLAESGQGCKVRPFSGVPEVASGRKDSAEQPQVSSDQVGIKKAPMLVWDKRRFGLPSTKIAEEQGSPWEFCIFDIGNAGAR
jgi:hypothetical protein